ncbi:MAG: trypsin-like peptidase domain-containing protein [Planctomycetaceae bacterium]
MIQNLSPRIDAATHIRTIGRLSVWECMLSVVVFAAVVSRCGAADELKNPVQQRVTEICQNLQTATVRVRSGTDMSSGVIVSKSGLILTVAHGLKPGSDTATVVFANGTTCEVKRVVVNEQVDVALLVMDVASLNDVEWSVVPLPVVEVSMVGEVVMAGGFPAREPDGKGPVIRPGEILAVDQSALKTSCTLTSGDSGGPLVNSQGALIGLHRQIGVGAESNGHVALTSIGGALEKSEHWQTLTQHAGASSGTRLMSKELTAPPKVVTAASRATVAIQGRDDNGESAVRVLGTVLDDSHVATKLSEIVPYHALECLFSDGSMIAATLNNSDRSLDLAILKLASPYGVGKAVNAAYPELQSPVLFHGQIVFAATSLTDVSAAGMIGRAGFHEPALPVRFGATMQSGTDRVRITELSPNGSAVLAGLQVGDELSRVDGTAVTSLTVVGDLLKARQPGDWISIDVERPKRQFSVQAQLHHDPGQQFEKTEFLDGRMGRVSPRRSGFQGVLQHAIVLEPDACGGPLFDFDGRLIAINIARRARESTLAIPIDDVWKFAKSVE